MDQSLKIFKESFNLGNIKSKRILIFDKIRNIPYKISLGTSTPGKAMKSLLREQSGSCEAKHFLLGAMYEKMKLEVKYYTYKFLWKDIHCDFPKRIRTLSQRLLPEYHLVCKIKINGKWVLIDCTWDDGLKQAGFEVNKHWDGSKDTILAVKPIDKVIHKNVYAQNLFVKNKRKNYTLNDNKMFFKFSKEFNSWLNEIRER